MGRQLPESPSNRSNPPHFGFAGRRGNLLTGAALPKSHSLAQMRCLSGHHVRSTLLLLMSRCAKPAPWRYTRASHISFAIEGMSSKGMSFETASFRVKWPGIVFRKVTTLISWQRRAFHILPPWQNSVIIRKGTCHSFADSQRRIWALRGSVETSRSSKEGTKRF